LISGLLLSSTKYLPSFSRNATERSSSGMGNNCGARASPTPGHHHDNTGTTGNVRRAIP
jgi:hypothetical protein